MPGDSLATVDSKPRKRENSESEDAERARLRHGPDTAGRP